MPRRWIEVQYACTDGDITLLLTGNQRRLEQSRHSFCFIQARMLRSGGYVCVSREFKTEVTYSCIRRNTVRKWLKLWVVKYCLVQLFGAPFLVASMISLLVTASSEFDTDAKPTHMITTRVR